MGGASSSAPIAKDVPELGLYSGLSLY